MIISHSANICFPIIRVSLFASESEFEITCGTAGRETGSIGSDREHKIHYRFSCRGVEKISSNDKIPAKRCSETPRSIVADRGGHKLLCESTPLMSDWMHLRRIREIACL